MMDSGDNRGDITAGITADLSLGEDAEDAERRMGLKRNDNDFPLPVAGVAIAVNDTRRLTTRAG